MDDGGRFGVWGEDEDGNPCFDLRPESVRCDVWHQVGNDRVTATAHADGTLTLYWCEEGLVRLTDPPAPRAFSWRERLSWRTMLAASALSRRFTEALRSGLGWRMRLHPRQVPELRAVLLVPGRSAQLRFAMGVAPAGGVADAIAALRTASRRETASAWHGQLRLELPADPALAREAAWHAMYLRSARVRDTVLGSGYVSQGSAYTFVHGLSVATTTSPGRTRCLLAFPEHV